MARYPLPVRLLARESLLVQVLAVRVPVRRTAEFLKALKQVVRRLRVSTPRLSSLAGCRQVVLDIPRQRTAIVPPELEARSLLAQPTVRRATRTRSYSEHAAGDSRRRERSTLFTIGREWHRPQGYFHECML